VKPALLDALHNRHNDPSYNGIPEDSIELHRFLIQKERTIKNLLRLEVLTIHQRKLLLPEDGRTDSSKRDITLIAVVARNFLDIPSPRSGWQKAYLNDTSLAAGFIKARLFRNELYHDDTMELYASGKDLFLAIKHILICLCFGRLHLLEEIFELSLLVEKEKLKSKGR